MTLPQHVEPTVVAAESENKVNSSTLDKELNDKVQQNRNKEKGNDLNERQKYKSQNEHDAHDNKTLRCVRLFGYF